MSKTLTQQGFYRQFDEFCLSLADHYDDRVAFFVRGRPSPTRISRLLNPYLNWGLERVCPVGLAAYRDALNAFETYTSYLGQDWRCIVPFVGQFSSRPKRRFLW